MGIVALLFIAMIPSTLTAQENDYYTKEWQSVTEGNYEAKNYTEVGDYIIMITYLDEGKKIPIVAGKQAIAPINIWSKDSLKFLTFESNWNGNPPIHPKYVYKFDSLTFFITDGYKIVKASIDTETRFIDYDKIFQGSSGLDMTVYGYAKGKNYLYFSSNGTGCNIHIFEERGVYIKTIKVNDFDVDRITSISEIGDSLWFTYSYYGPSDGSGVAVLNTETGAIRKVYDPEWTGNFMGCTLKNIGSGTYLFIYDSPKYDLDGTLLKYVDGKWMPIIQRSATLTDVDGHVLVYVFINAIYIPTGENINPGEPHSTIGRFYFINDDMTLSPPIDKTEVKNLLSDPRLLGIGFSEEFDGEFYQRHGEQPNLDFIYEQDSNNVFAFGNHIVAKLVTKTGSTGTYLNPKPTIGIYPNPATDYVYITGLQKPTEYVVSNTMGQIVLTGKTDNSVDVSTLEPGFYIISFNNQHIRFLRN